MVRAIIILLCLYSYKFANDIPLFAICLRPSLQVYGVHLLLGERKCSHPYVSRYL